MDSTSINTILLYNTEIQKSALSGIGHKASRSEIVNEIMINKLNQETLTLSKLPDKIKINIFKYVRFPMNLLLTSDLWYQLSKQNVVRAKWLIYHFGKGHALFYAIHFGPNFINVPVVQKIIEFGGIVSRYFVQRFLLSFGAYDPKLIQKKIEHNVGNIDIEQIRKVQQKHATPWASDTPLDVFT
ncbi:14680_t:CDS:2 [Cetraspora pellucida]|uniref:14680_t:CDS:1 n=1 Tax=Cetraspora pellucida TaxID=1433469 RepID=A0A9N9I2J1_9GLOM|nr:14680_t:CDS:2 [Cetraspora pellucida]